MQGRIPKPKQINKLRGDMHKRRRKLAEPKASQNQPICPDWLDAVAAEEWHRSTAQLDQMGLLSATDQTAIDTPETRSIMLQSLAKNGFEETLKRVKSNIEKTELERLIAHMVSELGEQADNEKQRQQILQSLIEFGPEATWQRLAVIIPQ
ncbi:hypothetical protein [Caulifigura coniformis]|nr:hypothetical protein [Caulifigura coniformis]